MCFLLGNVKCNCCFCEIRKYFRFIDFWIEGRERRDKAEAAMQKKEGVDCNRIYNHRISFPFFNVLCKIPTLAKHWCTDEIWEKVSFFSTLKIIIGVWVAKFIQYCDLIECDKSAKSDFKVPFKLRFNFFIWWERTFEPILAFSLSSCCLA